MKFLTLLCCFVSVFCGLHAQGNELPNLPLAFGFDDSEISSPLTAADAGRIRNQLSRLFRDEHLLGQGLEGQAFALAPRLDILEQHKADGMRAHYVASVELSISVRETASGVILDSYAWRLTGGGQSERQAVLATLRKIPGSDVNFTAFLEGLRPRLEKYYAANCDAIVARSERLVQTGDFDAAIVQLMGIPTEAGDCGQRAGEQLQKAYDEYQRKHCGPLVQEARARAANQDYREALDILLLVSPTSPCAEDANALIEQIGQTKSDLEADKLAFARDIYKLRADQQELNRQLSLQRWITVGEIAKSVGDVAGLFKPTIRFKFGNNR